MKLSKLMNVVSVIVGLAGVVMFVTSLIMAYVASPSETIFGLSQSSAVVCSGILIIIAIWVQIATIYHMMLEKDK